MTDGKQDNGKRRYIMCNLVYGANYPMLWLENQLKSLCDPTNLPALRADWDLEYVVFTDEQTLQQITRHPNFMALTQVCELNVVKLAWPTDADQFGSRYQLLVQMIQETLKIAVQKQAFAMSAWVADLVFAKESLPKMLSRLTAGHDAVINVPIRSAADPVHPLLAQLPGAPTDLQLFEMAYANLHHLWTHATWNNPYFTRMPYSMLWNSGTGLCAHNFSITPIVFRPTAEMRDIRGGIDTDLPKYFKNPFWAEDWTDAAVAGVEPLSNGHYPPFRQVQREDNQIDYVVQWAQEATAPEQADHLLKPLFYPSRQTFCDDILAQRAVNTMQQVQRGVRQLREIHQAANLSKNRFD